MKQRSYSKRIAFNFMAATAILVFLIFGAIYLVVYRTVYSSIDRDLETEYHEVRSGITVLDEGIIFANNGEWEENEHAQIEVNPTFIQVSDSMGNSLKRSVNLVKTSLHFLPGEDGKIFFNDQLPTGKVRQLQVVVTNERNVKAGFISVAIPLEASLVVLNNLLLILLSAFPFVLVILYGITRLMAHKSILPVRTLIESAGKIRRDNLGERIMLPQKKDELFLLTETINSLLDRIEDAVVREKQFSSDASHELRTPLSVLKGTLELMIRRPRDAAYFKEKTVTCLEEVNRMSALVDQLLMLARYENEEVIFEPVLTNIPEILNRIIARSASLLENKDIGIDMDLDTNLKVLSEPFMLEQILENIFSNAVKYSGENATIRIFSGENPLSVTIQDEGIGMDKGELAQIFDRFYRADESRNSSVKGYGLGLAISKRFADLLSVRITAESRPGKGSAFVLTFSGSSR